MTILRITIILLTLLFPSYAVLLGPNQNVVQAEAAQPIKPPSLPNPGAPLSKAGWKQIMTSHLTMFSTPVMLTLAKDFGVRQVAGKAVNQPSTQNGMNVKPKLPNGLNIPIVGPCTQFIPFSGCFGYEDTSIAFDPTNEQYGYAVALFDALTLPNPPPPSNPVVGFDCTVFETTNGGTTWNFVAFLPLSFGTDTCADPVVRWSPDGFVAYFTYLSVASDGSTSDLDFVQDTCPPFGCGFARQVLLAVRPPHDIHRCTLG